MKHYNVYIFGFLTGPVLLFGNPEGGTVVSGEASIHQMDNGTLRVESAHGSIIEWQKFSIAEGETTHFAQPNPKSAVLNRVVGKEKSLLSGKLESNGKVFLINPYGILITKSGVINTGGFFAATHHLSDEEFLQQQELVFKGVSKEPIVNYGTIEAANGDVALIAHSVDNQGFIRAPQGEVFLGAGGEVILRPLGDDRMQIRLSESVDRSEEVGVHHAGAIEAIKATLKADGNLCALAINQEGLINATGVVHKDGQVFLVAEKGTMHMSGNIAAHNSDGSGGEVRVLGDQVALIEEASIDVSGSMKGGTVLVGGDYRGSNPEIPNAQGVFIGERVTIDASAIKVGDGGKVVVWGDQSTAFYGNIKAEGGWERGDGGFVEISSKGAFFPKGRVSTYASNGKIGSLLLDPTDVTISSSPTMNASFNGLPFGPFTVSYGAAPPTNIDWADLLAFLGTNNVTIDTSAPIDNGQPGTINITSSMGGLYGGTTLFLVSPSNVNISAILSNASSGSLNINAGGNITFNNTINWGSGALTFNAGGTLIFNNAFIVRTNNGNLSFSTGGDLNISSAQVGEFTGGASFTGTVGGNANLSGDSGGVALLLNIGSGSGPVNFTVTGDLNMIDNVGSGTSGVSFTAGTNSLISAGGSMTMLNRALITAGGSNTVVYDQSRGCSTGSSTFRISGTSSLTSGLPAPLYIYGAALGSITVQDPTVSFNGIQNISLTGASALEFAGYCYNTFPTSSAFAFGFTGNPLNVFYKGIANATQVLQIVLVSGNFTTNAAGSPAMQMITQDGIQLHYVMPYPFSFALIQRPVPQVETSAKALYLKTPEETQRGTSESTERQEAGSKKRASWWGVGYAPI